MATAQQATQPNPLTTGYETIAIPTDGRAVLVGKTGSGKSVLAERLIQHWRQSQPNPRVLIVDSKPRFRASHELNGRYATGRYKRWGYGGAVPESVVLPLHPGADVKAQLRQTWRLGFNTAIAQVDSLAKIGWLEQTIGTFYADSDKKYQQLIYIDEVADFFGTAGMYGRGNTLVQAIRSGRERGVAVMAATQRPTGVPKSFLTEASRTYVFRLKYRQDLKHLQETCLPEEVSPPSGKHTFFLYDDEEEAGDYFRLRLEDA